jgi:hypothetical protein
MARYSLEFALRVASPPNGSGTPVPLFSDETSSCWRPGLPSAGPPERHTRCPGFLTLWSEFAGPANLCPHPMLEAATSEATDREERGRRVAAAPPRRCSSLRSCAPPVPPKSRRADAALRAGHTSRLGRERAFLALESESPFPTRGKGLGIAPAAGAGWGARAARGNQSQIQIQPMGKPAENQLKNSK